MRRGGFAIVLVGCWHAPSPPAPQPLAPPPPSLAGEYRALETMFVCDQPQDCEETFDDSMKLVELPGGALHARIELVKPVEHICRFEEDFVRAGEHRWTFDEGGCHVELIHRVDVVELSSEGCPYCEPPAVLEATFPYPPRRRDD